MPPLRMAFIRSATAVADLPPTASEVAFVGRSNVGKSSLINAIAGRKDLALVSKTPGRTRLINIFQLEGTPSTVVDLPGYGYAAVSKSAKAAWSKMIESYLLDREELEMVAVLVDGEVGPTRLDKDMLAWLRSHELPHTVVATKADKVKASQRGKRQRDLARGCDLEPGDVVWVSASGGQGIDRLRGLVLTWLST